MAEIDFEGNQMDNHSNDNSDINNQQQNNQQNNQQDDPTSLDDNSNSDINNQQNTDNNSNNDKPHDYDEGTEVEVDGVVYTIDASGNLVNDKGEVFKEAKDVKSFIEANVTSDSDDDSLSFAAIKDAIGIDITDENGKPVEFTNNAKGVKSYIDSVISLKSNELQQGAINKLFADNPMLKTFVDYVQLNGTYKGFGELPDRSGIVLDEKNDAQLETIIKMAANEFGNKSLNDSYIKYLKSTGELYNEAKTQLEALVAKDKQNIKEITEEAERVRNEELQAVKNYWNGVNEAITNRRIGKYLLPETIVKEVNGQKITCKLDDFYAYVSKETEVDANGNRMTGYARDLNNLSDKDVLNRELLDAWLLWTGGTYADLVNMAIKEESVRRLVVKSKDNRSAHSVNVRKPNKAGDKTQLVFE